MRITAGEIYRDHTARTPLLACHPDLDGNFHRLIADSVVVEKILGAIAPARQLCQKCPHHALGVVEQFLRSALGSRQAIAFANFAQAFCSGMTGSELCSQVSLAFDRCTDIAQKKRKYVRLSFPSPHKFDRRDAKSFLVDLTAKSHGAGISAADVGVMCARRHVEIRQGVGTWTLPIDRRYQRDVGQMGSAAERIVQHRDIAGAELESIENGANRHGHGAQMHRHVVAHGQNFAVRIEDGARIVAAFLDVG